MDTNNDNKWKKTDIDPLPSDNYHFVGNDNITKHEFYDRYIDLDNHIKLGLYLFIFSLCVLNNNIDYIVGLIFILGYIYKLKNIIKIIDQPEWLLRLLNHYIENKINTPPILDINSYFPNGLILQDNYNIIKDEILSIHKYVKNMKFLDESIPGTNYIARDKDMTNNSGWRVVILKFEGKITGQCKLYTPNLMKFLENMPEARNVFISTLEGKKHIPIHNGYTKLYIRCLLGIDCPLNKSFIYINKKKYIFENNKIILFDDLYPHEVYNTSDNNRIILYIDVVRNFESKFLNYIINNLFRLTSLSETINNLQKQYEPVPKEIGNFY